MKSVSTLLEERIFFLEKQPGPFLQVISAVNSSSFICFLGGKGGRMLRAGRGGITAHCFLKSGVFSNTNNTLDNLKNIFSYIFFLNKNFLKVFCRDKCMLWIQNQESEIHDLFFFPCPISFSIPDHGLSSPQLLLLFLNSCEVTGLFGELIVNTLGHTPTLRESTKQCRDREK